MRLKLLAIAGCLILAGSNAALAQGDVKTIVSRLGQLTFDHGLPTPDTRQKLYDEFDFQRGVQGVLWAEPAINNALFQRATEGRSNDEYGACGRSQRHRRE